MMANKATKIQTNYETAIGVLQAENAEIDALREAKDKLASEDTALAAERKSLSVDAARGDPAARKRVADILNRRQEIVGELEIANDALAAMETSRARAQETALEAAGLVAEELAAGAAIKMVLQAKAIDDKISELHRAIGDFRDATDELAAVARDFPTSQAVGRWIEASTRVRDEELLQRAAAAGYLDFMMNVGRHVAVSDKQKFAQIVGAHVADIAARGAANA